MTPSFFRLGPTFFQFKEGSSKPVLAICVTMNSRRAPGLLWFISPRMSFYSCSSPLSLRISGGCCSAVYESSSLRWRGSETVGAKRRSQQLRPHFCFSHSAENSQQLHLPADASFRCQNSVVEITARLLASIIMTGKSSLAYLGGVNMN
jgi:hypothetical protein